MNKNVFYFFLLLAAILACLVWSDATGGTAQQNKVLNKQDIKNYMKQINDQFGIVGRPRFGKRYFGKRDWRMRRDGDGGGFSKHDLYFGQYLGNDLGQNHLDSSYDSSFD